MAPYVNLLVPELQKSIVDPLPDVRAQASKALGALMGDMGRDTLQTVMPWLIETLKSKGSTVERSGAAQASSHCFVFSLFDFRCVCRSSLP